MNETRTPAEVFPPGEFLADELAARGWSQTDLAHILGRDVNLVNDIIRGKRGITPETAQGLADAMGTSARYWLNLDAIYRLSQIERSDTVSRRARLFEIAPVKEMIKRQWIEDSDEIEVLENSVTEFLGIDSIEDEVDFTHAARKSTFYDEPPSSAQFAWLRRARKLALAVDARPFSSSNVTRLVEQLRLLMESPEEVRHVPRVLADFGVRILLLEHLAQTKIDGATFWLNHGSPVIVLSLRYDRIDHFWHTLMHEVAHVRYGDGLEDDRALLDIEMVADKTPLTIVRPDYEERADVFATNAIIPTVELEDFIRRVRPLYSGVRIQGFAKRMGVHAGIVVGQLQHRGEISYANLRRMLTPVRRFVVASGLTDGWGEPLPVAV